MSSTLLNFGRQTKAASVPAHALIKKLILSPANTEMIIVIKANKAEGFAMCPGADTASEIITTNTGRPTFAK